MYFAFLCREQYATYNIFYITLLFIYLLLCSIVQYPSLLEHYASQRIFLAIRVRWHTIHSRRNKKYIAFRFGIPPYRQHFITFISHHLYWNLNPFQHCFRQGTVHPIQDFFSQYQTLPHIQFNSLLLAETQPTVHKFIINKYLPLTLTTLSLSD